MYATLEDVRLALTAGGVSTDTTTAAGLPDPQITDSIHEAMSTVDVYVAAHFTWDRNVEPAIQPIRWLTRDIAAYLATLVYRKGKDLALTDPIALRYAHAMRALADIAAGRVVLVDPAAPEVEGDPEAYNLYEGHLFGPEDFNLTRIPSRYSAQPRLWPGY